jgi:RNA-directed DNA polymerase
MLKNNLVRFLISGKIGTSLIGDEPLREVCRLQARIVKALQERRFGKVKALQRLLTHSFSGKVLGTRRVTENKAKSWK